MTAASGATVEVPPAPAPDEFVIVRVEGIGGGVVGRLRSILWKSPVSHVTLDGYRYRLVPGTAGDGLVLAVPAGAQGSYPFSFGAPIKTIAIDAPASGGKLTYEFLAVPFPSS